MLTGGQHPSGLSPTPRPSDQFPAAFDFLVLKITVELPEDLAQHADPGREALEALAIEGHRSSALLHYQASQLLGLSRFEFDGFLQQRRIYDHAYDLEDLDQDLKTLRQLEAKGLLPG